VRAVAQDLGDRVARFERHLQKGYAHYAGKWRGPGRYALEFVGARHGLLPDFLVIGAMKAGSTMFYDWLVSHPLVLPAVEKEVHFFDFHFRQGELWYRSQLPTERERAALASRAGRPVLAGEASPTYLYHPLAARRARSLVPGAKLVVLLRNPVDRAYSHYYTGIRNDYEALSFEEAIEREPARLEGQVDALLMDQAHNRNFPHYRWSYLAMGHYAEQVEKWFEQFPRQQFLFLLNEEMDQNPDAVFRRVYEFLELPYHLLPQLTRRGAGNYPPMKDGTREQLTEYFRPHNRRLAELLCMELGWDD
jgi:Sulfotransferase domain